MKRSLIVSVLLALTATSTWLYANSLPRTTSAQAPPTATATEVAATQPEQTPTISTPAAKPTDAAVATPLPLQTASAVPDLTSDGIRILLGSSRATAKRIAALRDDEQPTEAAWRESFRLEIDAARQGLDQMLSSRVELSARNLADDYIVALKMVVFGSEQVLDGLANQSNTALLGHASLADGLLRLSAIQ